MIELPKEFREAWQYADGFDKFAESGDVLSYEKHLANCIVFALAGWERERFKREHQMAEFGWGCDACDDDDPRHKWTDEQWQ